VNNPENKQQDHWENCLVLLKQNDPVAQSDGVGNLISKLPMLSRLFSRQRATVSI